MEVSGAAPSPRPRRASFSALPTARVARREKGHRWRTYRSSTIRRIKKDAPSRPTSALGWRRIKSCCRRPSHSVRTCKGLKLPQRCTELSRRAGNSSVGDPWPSEALARWRSSGPEVSYHAEKRPSMLPRRSMGSSTVQSWPRNPPFISLRRRDPKADLPFSLSCPPLVPRFRQDGFHQQGNQLHRKGILAEL